MNKFERIFLYTVLAILVFYVFLVDNNAESQVAIQEEIRTRSILIVNDEGREVVMLCSNEAGHGGIVIFNKESTVATNMMATEDGGMVSIANKAGKLVAIMGVDENDNGEIRVYNKNRKVIGSLP